MKKTDIFCPVWAEAYGGIGEEPLFGYIQSFTASWMANCRVTQLRFKIIETLIQQGFQALNQFHSQVLCLDRLARSTLHLCQLVEQLKKKRVELQVLDQSIDTRDAPDGFYLMCLGRLHNLKRKYELNDKWTGFRIQKLAVSNLVEKRS